MPAGEQLRCSLSLSLWKTEKLLRQMNCNVEKTAAVDLSDISLDASIPEGHAYDFLTNTSPTASLLTVTQRELPAKLS